MIVQVVGVRNSSPYISLLCGDSMSVLYWSLLPWIRV